GGYLQAIRVVGHSIPAHGARLWADCERGGHFHRESARRRGPDESAQPRVFGDHDSGHGGVLRGGLRDAPEHSLALRRRGCGHRYQLRVRLDHAILHGVSLSAGPVYRGKLEDRRRDEYHHRFRGGAGVHGPPRAHNFRRPDYQLFFGLRRAWTYLERRLLRHGDCDHGDALDGRLHPCHGHFRTDYGQRRRHHRDVEG